MAVEGVKGDEDNDVLYLMGFYELVKASEASSTAGMSKGLPTRFMVAQ